MKPERSWANGGTGVERHCLSPAITGLALLEKHGEFCSVWKTWYEVVEMCWFAMEVVDARGDMAYAPLYPGFQTLEVMLTGEIGATRHRLVGKPSLRA